MLKIGGGHDSSRGGGFVQYVRLEMENGFARGGLGVPEDKYPFANQSVARVVVADVFVKLLRLSPIRRTYEELIFGHLIVSYDIQLVACVLLNNALKRVGGIFHGFLIAFGDYYDIIRKHLKRKLKF